NFTAFIMLNIVGVMGCLLLDRDVKIAGKLLPRFCFVDFFESLVSFSLDFLAVYLDPLLVHFQVVIGGITDVIVAQQRFFEAADPGLGVMSTMAAIRSGKHAGRDLVKFPFHYDFVFWRK